jgi:hypothetical protein
MKSLGMIGANEIWGDIDNGYNNSTQGQFARGGQNASSPFFNFWDGNIFRAIRDCNTFLENIHLPYDIEEDERNQWIAEVKFLKAYYHFYLLQLYGPIPIIRENLSIGADVEEVRVFREPVDEVVDYIVELIDEALPYLMPTYDDSKSENGGRITTPAAAAIKAKVLVLAASPLLNGTAGTPPEFSLVDKRGIELFPREYKAEKWERARDAVAQAIEISHQAGHRLYKEDMLQFVSAYITDTTLHKLALRFAVCEAFNREIVWASVIHTIGGGEIQSDCIPNVGMYVVSSTRKVSSHGTTLRVAEEFYSRNGVPIEEDDEWVNKWLGGNFTDRYGYAAISPEEGSSLDGVSSISEDHKYYLGTYRSYTGDWRTHGKMARAGTSRVEYTGKLHFYREPRFYAWIGCDRGIWEIATWSDTARIPGPVSAFASAVNYVLATKYGEDQGKYDNSNSSLFVPCGYFAKKLVSPEFNKSNAIETDYVGSQNMTYPIVRLSDLYLLYAETLNETKSTPDAEVYRWIDLVRERARLKPVVEAWRDHAIPSAKNKPLNKEGMREIIKRERMIELSFESVKFYDLLRWKDAMNYLRQPVQGWNRNGGGYEDEQRNLDAYYRVTTYMDGTPFNSRNYFFPISKASLRKNTNLVQNPGWEGIGN